MLVYQRVPSFPHSIPTISTLIILLAQIQNTYKYIYIYTQISITYTLYCIPIILPFGHRPGYANDTLVTSV